MTFNPNNANNPNRDRMQAEKALRDAIKALEGKNFDSLEDANAYLSEVMMGSGSIGGITPGPSPPPAPATPLEEAEEMMYSIWETNDPGERAQIAMKAIELSMDCVDAWVYLADEVTDDLHDAIKCANTGVLAGERVLGPEVFEEYEGDFWGYVKTRPYMRALITLAGYLWMAECYDEAADIYRKMLRLNPGDNQGVRYIVAMDFAKADCDDLFAEVLELYPDDAFATMTYGRALWLFRRDGGTPAADEALGEAFLKNTFVPGFLLGHKKIPKQIPHYYSPGGRDEAICYAVRAKSGWEASNGALKWLSVRKKERTFSGDARKRKSKKRSKDKKM